MSEEDICKFIETKMKMDELQKRHDKYRKIVEEHMLQQGLTSIEKQINGQNYKIKKSLLSRESISKKELPQDIWDKYCKSSSYTTLRITKLK